MDHNPKFTYLSLQLNHFLKNEFPIPNYYYYFLVGYVILWILVPPFPSQSIVGCKQKLYIIINFFFICLPLKKKLGTPSIKIKNTLKKKLKPHGSHGSSHRNHH